MHNNKKWPVRLGVRTSGFHPGNRGSNPLRATSFTNNKELKMANHKSAIKRIKVNNKKRLLNRYQSVTARNSITKFKALQDKKEAEEALPGVVSKVDKLVKKNIIHANKGSRIKSQLSKHVAAL